MKLLALALLAALPLLAQFGGELRFALRSEPKTLHPLLVTDENSEAVRYLTTGVLVRMNRKTQKLEPELATAWKVLDGGKRIQFDLRKDVKFSDGSPFDAQDVRHTLLQMMDPALKSPLADAFKAEEGKVGVRVLGPHRLEAEFPSTLANLDRLFDGVPILSSRSPLKERAGTGPFIVAEHKAGSHLLLKRNPWYWKQDAASGRRLPYLDAVRIEIQQNSDLEYLRFRRGELHLLAAVTADNFERLGKESPSSISDAGPSLESELLWFNQVGTAPIPAHKRQWFRSREFRRAISAAIQRADLCRLVYRGSCEVPASPVGTANRLFHNAKLKPLATDPALAMKLLAQAGFKRQGTALVDAGGHAVEFSLITNAGNKNRARIAAMLQQDLAKIGVKLNIVTLDFPSLVERLTRTRDYESCLLSMANIELDPGNQMNLWLSSGSVHPWNPLQKQPATPWEAEIDKLMRAQAATPDYKKRKAAFDRVQEILWEEQPVIYLATPHVLTAVAPGVKNAQPVPLRPRLWWNADQLQLTRAEVARAQ